MNKRLKYIGTTSKIFIMIAIYLLYIDSNEIPHRYAHISFRNPWRKTWKRILCLWRMKMHMKSGEMKNMRGVFWYSKSNERCSCEKRKNSRRKTSNKTILSKKMNSTRNRKLVFVIGFGMHNNYCIFGKASESEMHLSMILPLYYIRALEYSSVFCYDRRSILLRSHHYESFPASMNMNHYRITHPLPTSLIRKGKFVQWRISRWEYWISYLILVALSSTIGTILRHLAGGIGELIASIIGIIFSIFQIKLIIKRSHDIEESARYSFVPLFIMLGIGLVSALILPKIINTQGVFTDGAAFQSFLTARPSLLAWGLLLITFVRLIIRSCKLIFQKWTMWENTYGANPLDHQTSSNKRYRVLGCAMVLISTIASALGKPVVTPTYDTIDPTATDSIEEVVTP